MRLIDADAVYPWYIKAFKGKIEPSDIRFSMNDIKANLDNIPTAEKERRSGHWNTIQGDIVVCSACGMGAPQKMTRMLVIRYAEPNRTNYCPNCGARMEDSECQK